MYARNSFCFYVLLDKEIPHMDMIHSDEFFRSSNRIFLSHSGKMWALKKYF